MNLDWNRLEHLRGPKALVSALQHLGLFQIRLIRKELREETGEVQWIELPLWLKNSHPFLERLEQNEIGFEVMKKLREEVRNDALRLNETIFKTNSLGLTDVAVPVVLRGERLGFLMTGGFVLDEALRSEVDLEERLKVLMLPLEELKRAISEWRTLPHFSDDKRSIVIQMMQLLSQEIVQFFDEMLIAQEREEILQKHTFDRWITAHPPLRSFLKKLPAMSQSDLPVLILGEPGTGREFLAKLIHDKSLRKEKPFTVLHCSHVAENLLEAELFGYEKGAFPGAYHSKAGIFEVAESGTIYFKEIGDLSLSIQIKILRLFQEKTFSRLGSDEKKQVNVRIMASTQRNLRKLAQMGAFRQDLFYLFNTFEFEIPPLRQRKEDVPLFAQAFLIEFMKTMNKEGIQWKDESLRKLGHYNFPGNVTELRNEVERLVALKDSFSLIDVRDLNPKIVEVASPLDEIENGRTLKSLVDDYEKQIIQDSLSKYNWNKSRVADLFQITRQGLLKKIVKHKLDRRGEHGQE